MGKRETESEISRGQPPSPTTSRAKMPQSKKDLRAQKQRQNMKAGIGDEKGRLPANQKAENVMAACTICKQIIRMIKANTQAKQHVESKHSGKKFDECFPGFTCSLPAHRRTRNFLKLTWNPRL